MNIEVLLFRELDYSGLRHQVDKVVAHLAKGNFRAADARKLVGSPFYRARLDDTNRLLFRFASQGARRIILVLEVIRNHAYDKSRFLRDGGVSEAILETLTDTTDSYHASDLFDADALAVDPDVTPIQFLNSRYPYFHLLDKIVSLDEAQAAVFSMPLPLILIGSAGSGKTVVTIEKMKEYPGRQHCNCIR